MFIITIIAAAAAAAAAESHGKLVQGFFGDGGVSASEGGGLGTAEVHFGDESSGSSAGEMGRKF